MSDPKEEQFGKIYDLYIEKVYRFVYLKVNSQEVAEDITSKVFIKAWKAFQGPDFTLKNEGAFLFKIARNAVIDHYRQKGRQKTVSVDASPEMIDQGADAHDLAILSADVNLVKRAISKLDKEQQDIIIWHYLDDMTIPEIAGLLGRPEGTVRVMLHRGLKDLKEMVKQ